MTDIPSNASDTPLSRIIATQGGLLFIGATAGQLMSLARNAMLAHMLAKGDFGIAAVLTITLQMIEMLSDLAIDRMIVRDKDGDRKDVMAVGHTLLIARGAVLFVLLAVLAPLMASAFAIPSATEAFAALALIPLIKGFQHLDVRRFQRRYENRPLVWMETLPQAIALVLTPLVITTTPSFEAVVVLATIQAGGALVVSHHIAERPYRLGWSWPIVRNYIGFGWPILLSAIPLIAVFQGDRFIVAHYFTMDDVAAYSVAFMITMLPGLLVTKVVLSLLLPMLASANHLPTLFRGRYRMMLDGLTVLATLYAVGLWCLGGPLVAAIFGPNFQDLGNLTAVLGLMWAVRLIQAVPGAALMAKGETVPLLVAGVVRSFALILAIAVASRGEDLLAIAAAGIIGELAALLVMAYSMARLRGELAGPLMRRALIVVGLTFVVALLVSPPSGSDPITTIWFIQVPLGILMLCLSASVVLMLVPTPRRLILNGQKPDLDMTALDALR